MPEEYIDVTIYYDGKLWARVDGEYPFYNFGHYTAVRMDYPIPRDARDRDGYWGISVKMDESPLRVTYPSEMYPTAIGDWRMISWMVSPAPWDYFMIKTWYTHSIPLVGTNFTFLYAMGTGRYLDTYAKETTAYIRIRIDADDITSLRIFTVGNVGGTWTWKPANYTVIQDASGPIVVDVITLEVKSGMWEPLIEDLLLTFHIKCDLSNDGKVDIHDLAAVALAFGSFPSHPRWKSIADLNGDEKIDIKDTAAIARNFGKTYL